MLSEQPLRLQLAFMTGQSNPRCCALSAQQQAFGEALLAPGRGLRMQNFPYRDESSEHTPVPLWRASWHNTAQYLESRRTGFVRSYHNAVLKMLSAAPHTLLLAGSCGLELLTNLALPADARLRISVLAYGPVSRRVPDCARLLTVAGSRDWISRIGYGRAMRSVACGHLDYLTQAEILALAQRFAAEVEAVLP